MIHISRLRCRDGIVAYIITGVSALRYGNACNSRFSSPSHLLKYFLYFRLQDPNTARLSPLLVVSGSRPRQATAKSPGPQPRSLRVVSLPRKRLQCSLPHARLLLPHARLLLPYPPSYRLGLWTSQEGEDALVLTVCRLPCALANYRNPSPVIVR